MNEHSYIRAVHRQLPDAIHVWKINVRFRNGVPDCWYSGGGADLWVEYKWLATVPKKVFKPTLSELQKKWLRDRYAEGRRVAVIVGSPQGGVILAAPLEWENQVGVTTWMKHADVADWIKHLVSST